ncbi:hypothetical protein H4217_001354 [Coemansia sp. RSA 1939]|nr:hypothetical protein H4217_001354 [Coemansia sp. RSA 1939]
MRTPAKTALTRSSSFGNDSARRAGATNSRASDIPQTRYQPSRSRGQTPVSAGPFTSGTIGNSDSGSDSEENDGFVRVDHWNTSLDPPLASFKPTIARSSPSSPGTLSTSASIAKPARLMEKVRSSLKAAVVAGASSTSSSSGSTYGFQSEPTADDATYSQQDPIFGIDDSLATCNTNTDSSCCTNVSSSDSDSSDSCSDDEISNVLDETEIQLIEAMEDTQIADAKHKGSMGALQHSSSSVAIPVTRKRTSASDAATTASSASHGSTSPVAASHATPIVGSPRKSLMLTGLSEGRSSSPLGYVDSLKERFSTSNMRGSGIGGTNSSLLGRKSPSGVGGKENDREFATLPDQHKTASLNSISDSTIQTAPATTLESNPSSQGFIGSGREADQGTGNKKSATRIKCSDGDNRDSSPATLSDAVNADDSASGSPRSVFADAKPAKRSEDRANATDGSNTLDARGADRHRPTSAPLDSVEFVAPGVTKQTAMSLLRRVLDIDGPVIQQKMVEFLLIDGVIASLSKSGHPMGQDTPATAEEAACRTQSHSFDGHIAASASAKSSSNSNNAIPAGVLNDFDTRNRHRERLQRQRSRCTGLSEDDLRRAYNATQMLCSRDQHARKVLEAKLSVVIPSLMANPPSRWWLFSDAVANGHAPICDVIPYLSEPCVQRLFLRAEFGVWTGKLMVSLNLSPNDAVVVSDELSRMGLGSVASALGPSADGASGQAQSQQRTKSMQLVRNRFQQLNRGAFLNKVLELVEDQDEQISVSVAEFVSHLINDFSAFYGFDVLFKPMLDSELPVRRLAQMIVNSPSQRLSPQARSATRVLHTLLTKTSCQYGLRAREAQGIRDPTMHPRGSHVLLQVGHAARNALGSFLPGLLATVTGQHKNSDLTSHSAYNRRVSVEALQLPEYEESDSDLDTGDTETETSENESDSDSYSSRLLCGTDAHHQQFEDIVFQRVDRSSKHAGDNSDSNSDGNMANSSNDVASLRSSAAALLHATYSGSIGSGSISSSLSPSSTLSASPLAIASSTPDDTYIREGIESEDLGLLLSLPKPDVDRLNLLKVCIEVLRESDEIDEIAGWIDLRIWRALGTWFLNHPHNNLLHLAVYQLVSIITLEAVRLRKLHRRLYTGIHSKPLHTQSLKMSNISRYPWRNCAYPSQNNNDNGFTKPVRMADSRASASTSDVSNYLSAHTHQLDDTTSSGSEGREASYQAQRKVHKRRSTAERIRYEETTNCDNILSYMVEQHQWADKLIRRTMSPNFDGAHGYIALILNTLRLGVQVDRKRSPNEFTGEGHSRKLAVSKKRRGRPLRYKDWGVGFNRVQPFKAVETTTNKRMDVGFEDDSVSRASIGSSEIIRPSAPKSGLFDEIHQGTLTDDGVATEALSEFSDDDGAANDNDLLPDLPYHDPATREKLCEYPLYRLQRWEISLLYSPSFQKHLRRLRSQASMMVDEINDFRLCDQSRTEIISSKSETGGKRPVPFFSPQKIRPPVLFDNVEIKKKQLQINVGLLLGNSTKRNPNSSSRPSGSDSANDNKRLEGSGLDDGSSVDCHIDEFGVDMNSLFARMLGFTEDLVELSVDGGSSSRLSVGGVYRRGEDLGQTKPAQDGKNVGSGAKDDKRTASGARKTHVAGNGSHSRPSSLRRKKSKPNAGLALASAQSATEFFEEMSPADAVDAAEAICSALANENASGTNTGTTAATMAKHSQAISRGRKKPASVSGSVRRRRAARLHNKTSNPSLGSQPFMPQQQQGPLDSKLAFSAPKLARSLSGNIDERTVDDEIGSSAKAADADDGDACDEISAHSPVSAIGLASSMQALDLAEQ